MKRWYSRDWTEYETVKENDAQTVDVKIALEEAVHRQLMSDVPYGVLLSGGLDSSVISAIAKKYAAKRIETDGASDAWWPQLHSFAIGLKGAPDLIKAREVAEYIGTVHHEINYTVQEGLDALRDVIYFIETYDVTTVRASTPMYLLARVIKSMGIKMVLTRTRPPAADTRAGAGSSAHNPAPRTARTRCTKTLRSKTRSGCRFPRARRDNARTYTQRPRPTRRAHRPAPGASGDYRSSACSECPPLSRNRQLRVKS